VVLTINALCQLVEVLYEFNCRIRSLTSTETGDFIEVIGLVEIPIGPAQLQKVCNNALTPAQDINNVIGCCLDE
jgi:hypothetical protein